MVTGQVNDSHVIGWPTKEKITWDKFVRTTLLFAKVTKLEIFIGCKNKSFWEVMPFSRINQVLCRSTR